MANPLKRILLVDDDVPSQRGMARLIELRLRVEVLTATSVLEAKAVVEGSELRPRAAVVDIALGAGGDGLSLVPFLGRLGIPALLFTGQASRAQLREAAQVRSAGVYFKVEHVDELLEALGRLVQGPAPTNAPEIPAEWTPLTPAEGAVLSRMCQDGEDPNAIAAGLGIAVRTARAHVTSILKKSGFTDRAALVSFLLRRQLWRAYVVGEPLPPRRG